ncbi:MAG: SDR family oxidoreductase, partial [Pseudolabrys sp.]
MAISHAPGFSGTPVAGQCSRAAYCATKGALIQLAKVMAIDHAVQNIRVNTLSPGAVET